MTVTKIIAIRCRLDHCLNYVKNGEKTKEVITTDLDYELGYITNEEKSISYCSTINCSLNTAYKEMQATKLRFGKTDGVLGYHIIQSFSPGDHVTPEQAHQIGLDFAQRLFGSNYEVVIGTHLDKAHIHNHIIINSVAFTDGSKYHSTPESYFKNIQEVSDELSREEGLTIIDPQNKGKHYTEWQAEKENKPTVRSVIKKDVDEALIKAHSFDSFVKNLKQMGYEVKYGQRIKYMAVRPPSSERFIRLKSLGEPYTEAAIRQRIIDYYNMANSLTPQPLTTAKKFRCKHPKRYVQPGQHRLKGFQALFFYYMYFFGKIQPRKQSGKRTAYLLRDEFTRFNRYKQEFHYLRKNGFTEAKDIQNQQVYLKQHITDLMASRQPLYEQRKSNPAQIGEITRQIQVYTTELRELRKQLKLCDDILSDSVWIEERVRQERQRTEEIQGRKTQTEPTLPRHNKLIR